MPRTTKQQPTNKQEYKQESNADDKSSNSRVETRASKRRRLDTPQRATHLALVQATKKIESKKALADAEQEEPCLLTTRLPTDLFCNIAQFLDWRAHFSFGGTCREILRACRMPFSWYPRVRPVLVEADPTLAAAKLRSAVYWRTELHGIKLICSTMENTTDILNCLATFRNLEQVHLRFGFARGYPLRSNQFRLDVRTLSRLSPCTKLSALDLGDCDRTPNLIGGLSKLGFPLQTLLLGMDVEDADLVALRPMHGTLQELVLSRCGLVTDAGLKPLGCLTSLESLEMRFLGNLERPAPFAWMSGLARLKHLTLVDLKLRPSGAPSALEQIATGCLALDSLEIMRTFWICDDNLGALAEHFKDRLKWLSLFQCARVSFTGVLQLREMKSLTSLNIEQTNCDPSDDGLELVLELPSLQHLQLSMAWCESEEEVLGSLGILAQSPKLLTVSDSHSHNNMWRNRVDMTMQFANFQTEWQQAAAALAVVGVADAVHGGVHAGHQG